MAAQKLLNLVALTSLAVLACSFGATPVNALAAGNHHIARHSVHDTLAKKKRSAPQKRCKQRASSSADAVSTEAAIASSTDVSVSSASFPAAAAVISTVVEVTDTPTPTPTTTQAPSSTQVATTTAAATTAAATTAAASSNGGKFGLAWPNGDDTSLVEYITSNSKTLYTWSPDCPSEAAALGIQCCPMLWGTNQVDEFSSKVVEGYANCAMGFNEPNQDTQSNLSPQDAANLWKEYIDPLKNKGYTLISPAVTSAPDGKVWMQDFFAACTDCQFDVVALHYYDINADNFIAYVEDFHTTFGKPIWITEYADQNFNGGAQATMDEVWAFHAQVAKAFNSMDYVHKYFAFGAMTDMQGVNADNQLMDPTTKAPTALGYTYLYNSWT